MEQQYVNIFGEMDGSKVENSKRIILGQKGKDLDDLAKLCIPVPQGFTVTTEAYEVYSENGQQMTNDMLSQIQVALDRLEKSTGKKLNDSQNPLLLAVYSDPSYGIPGTIKSYYYIGLNDITVEWLAQKTGDERFAYDSYRKFMMWFGDSVSAITSCKYEFKHTKGTRQFFKPKLEARFEQYKLMQEIKEDSDLSIENIKEIIEIFKQIYLDDKKEFPQDPFTQLCGVVMTIFDIWNSPRIVNDRKMRQFLNCWNIAATVQMMVFGNIGDNSGTGIVYSRNPKTGEKKLHGEYWVNTYNEDMIEGEKNSQPISMLEDNMAELYEQLSRAVYTLENHFTKIQKVEFTIEEGKLFLLRQIRSINTINADFRIATDMVKEGLISEKSAIFRIYPERVVEIFSPVFEQKVLEKAEYLTEGSTYNLGVAVGKVCLTVKDAKYRAKNGDRVILVCSEIHWDEIDVLEFVQGVLMIDDMHKSYALSIFQKTNRCFMTVKNNVKIDEENNAILFGNTIIRDGDYISIDGYNHNIYKGNIPVVPPQLSSSFFEFMEWVDKYRTLKVEADVSTLKEMQDAIEYGADGIGIIRTEHLFSDGDIINKFRMAIFSNDDNVIQVALDEIELFQNKYFENIFNTMNQQKVNIRLLDSPLYKFMPTADEEFEELALEIKKSLYKFTKFTDDKFEILAMDLKIRVEDLKKRARSLLSIDPVTGDRGCHLIENFGSIPILEMQVKAIFKAATKVSRRFGTRIIPVIMIPMVRGVNEMNSVIEKIQQMERKVKESDGECVEYMTGAIIETPRGALHASEIAMRVDLLTFDTDSLTRMTCGIPNRDVGDYLEYYQKYNMHGGDPSIEWDDTGVGMLIKWAVDDAKKAGKCCFGIHGKHTDNPHTIQFCHNIGIDHVSCSPSYIASAKLVAAREKLCYEDYLEQFSIITLNDDK